MKNLLVGAALLNVGGRTDRRGDRHEEANSNLSQLCERVKKFTAAMTITAVVHWMVLPCTLCVLRCVRSYFTVTPKTTVGIEEGEFFITWFNSFQLSGEKYRRGYTNNVLTGTD